MKPSENERWSNLFGIWMFKRVSKNGRWFVEGVKNTRTNRLHVTTQGNKSVNVKTVGGVFPIWLEERRLQKFFFPFVVAWFFFLDETPWSTAPASSANRNIQIQLKGRPWLEPTWPNLVQNTLLKNYSWKRYRDDSLKVGRAKLGDKVK